MKNKRIKIQLPNINTREEAEAVMHDIAAIANNQRRITADRDAEVLNINERYEASLTQCAEELQQKTDALRVWAETNPDQFPKGRKSIDFVSGVLGFRTGTPKLALTSRAFTWDKVLELLKTRWTHFIRSKQEVDKDAILTAAAAQKVNTQQLAALGLKVVQDESFFIDPKLTEVETRQTVEAA